MTNLPPQDQDDTRVHEEQAPEAQGTPRWVKIFGLVGLVLAALLIVGKLTGGHGPGRHMPQSEVSVTIVGLPVSSVIAG